MTAASVLPPTVRDARGRAFAAAIDGSCALDVWQACPLALSHSPDEVLWHLARQFDVAGPLYQAMRTRAQKERLVGAALRLQRRRGTPWSVEEVMRLMGWTDAEVIDRVSALRYDGAAMHDGQYSFEAEFNRVYVRYNGRIVHDGGRIFSGYYELDFENWRGYRIRLYMAEDSRPFADYDREQATMMAKDWAPLRSALAGFYARHVIESAASDPAYEIAQVHRVHLIDSKGSRQAAPHVWTEYFENNACAVRWRVSSDELRLPDVTGAALTDRGGNDLHIRRGLPIVHAAAGVIVEGVWRMGRGE